MVKVLCFGSLNVDYVYDVPHFLRAGETLASTGRTIYSGGKGLNQSIALAKAGITTFHAGAIGDDGDILLEALVHSGVDVSFVTRHAGPSGHTVIQRDVKGQNSILLFGGANRGITRAEIDTALQSFSRGDFLVLQNEINEVPYIMQQAKARGMSIVLNPSPMDESLLGYPLDMVDYFILNEIEATDILGKPVDPSAAPSALQSRFPSAAIVLTLGKQGVMYLDRTLTKPLQHGIYDVPVVDTTAAGDTFTGYFVASIANNIAIEEALRIASVASSIAVSRPGASPSIPTRAEVLSSNLKALK